MAHPYEDQEDTDLWKLLDRCIQQLEENSDLKLQTDRRYVVGYLCQQLSEGPCNHACSGEAERERPGDATLPLG